MSQSEPVPPAEPSSSSTGPDPGPDSIVQRLVRFVLRAVWTLPVVWDLRFGEREDLLPVANLPLPPLFVGGTGRSGTTILARIVGAHPAYHMIPFEIRFLSDRGGVSDLVAGRVGFVTFAWRLQHRWSVAGPRARRRALVSDGRQRAALIELRAGLKADRAGAAVRFVHRLLDPAALEAGASGWIEMTPGNVHVAPTLARCWPASKLMHAVRDGRDVACSVTPLEWGPETLDEALRWWGRSLDEAFASCAEAPDGFVDTVRMESLLATDRDAELACLLDFVGLEETPAVRAFFDERATMTRANLGRWRRDVPPGQVPGFLALHADLAAGLVAKGYPYVPYDEPAELLLAAEG